MKKIIFTPAVHWALCLLICLGILQSGKWKEHFCFHLNIKWMMQRWVGACKARQRAKIATFRTGKYRVKDLIGVQIFPLVCILVITLFAEFAGATFCFILTFLPLCGCWPSAGLRWAALLRAQGSSETIQQNGFVLIPWNYPRVSVQVYRAEGSRVATDRGRKLHRDWVLGGCKPNCANKF